MSLARLLIAILGQTGARTPVKEVQLILSANFLFLPLSNSIFLTSRQCHFIFLKKEKTGVASDELGWSCLQPVWLELPVLYTEDHEDDNSGVRISLVDTNSERYFTARDQHSGCISQPHTYTWGSAFAI